MSQRRAAMIAGVLIGLSGLSGGFDVIQGLLGNTPSGAGGSFFTAPAGAQSIPLTPTAQASGAVITHEQGIEFVTVGAPGGVANAPWAGNGTVGDRAIGRGSVGYDYRIGRFEVTTEQWVEFYNAAFDRPRAEWLPHLVVPSFWGAGPAVPNTPGGLRWSVPVGNERRAVGNISWRMAAMYCNWLHNDKMITRDAFLGGAYDVSTFRSDDMGFLDQTTRSPGARFFIPTFDEQIKAFHYDPNRNGPGAGGYWLYNHASDTRPIYGPPPGFNFGAPGNQANAGFFQFDPTVPLGSYPSVQSPWGLLDMAGGTSEWNEEIIGAAGRREARLMDGSYWGSSIGTANVRDQVSFVGGEFPSISTFDFGFRIAAAVPAPGPCGLGLILVVSCLTSRRRRIGNEVLQSSVSDPCARSVGNARGSGNQG